MRADEGRGDEAVARLGAEDARPDASRSEDSACTGPDEAPVGPEATLDPMVQVLGSLAPRALPASASARPPEPAAPLDARAPLEQLMTRLVRRVAWSGNARSGVARLELGAGELAGATLTIQADDGVVRVALDLPPGADGAAWRERISGRLGARGLQVESIEVA